MRYLSVTAIACQIMASCAVGQEIPHRLYAAFSVSEPPVIDGRLDDPCWQPLAETSDFTCIQTRRGPAPAQTYAKIGMTKSNLLLAFRCMEPEMDKVLEALKVEDRFRECVEIFIDANLDRRTYSQYRVSSGGLLAAHKGYGGPHGGNSEGFTAAVSFEKDAWTVEVAIAFSLIGHTPSMGEIWGFNLNRARSIVVPPSLDCWSNTGDSFHAPEKFGQVLFGSFDNWKKATYHRDMHVMQDKLRMLINKYPQSIPNGDELVKQLDPTAQLTEAKITTEPDMLAAMSDILQRREKGVEVLNTVRLMVIRGEFK